MIVVDTSALNEPEADACVAALTAEDDLVISAGTMAEALIGSARRKVGEEMARLLDGLVSRHCERSEAIHAAERSGGMDCFVVSLLAMTTVDVPGGGRTRFGRP
jgi:uncharacterized protein with PIN domain